MDRIAPTLGEPPPPPKLKPTPTLAPLSWDRCWPWIRINADLVQLHVRVIDRDNRPINNVTQNEFRVYEDGVAQPIEYFTREDVPISYGLAVDTSGSLRSQLQSVIGYDGTIINSNKPGDETFLVKFISSDKMKLCRISLRTKSCSRMVWDRLYVEGGQTAIIDAVYLSAEHVSDYKKGDQSDRRRR